MIEKISTAQQQLHENFAALIMVGSFAPVHSGHIDSMESAERTLMQRGEGVCAE